MSMFEVTITLKRSDSNNQLTERIDFTFLKDKTISEAMGEIIKAMRKM